LASGIQGGIQGRRVQDQHSGPKELIVLCSTRTQDTRPTILDLRSLLYSEIQGRRIQEKNSWPQRRYWTLAYKDTEHPRQISGPKYHTMLQITRPTSPPLRTLLYPQHTVQGRRIQDFFKPLAYKDAKCKANIHGPKGIFKNSNILYKDAKVQYKTNNLGAKDVIKLDI
jgi:hypothetical protein